MVVSQLQSHAVVAFCEGLNCVEIFVLQNTSLKHEQVLGVN